MKGCIADAACGQPDLVCDLTTNLCTAGWLADVSDMIAAGERALVIAQAVAASLATAGDTRTGGTLVRLASVLGDLLDLRGEEEDAHEDAVQFTEAVLSSLNIVLLSYDGWKEIFRLATRYEAASAYLRYNHAFWMQQKRLLIADTAQTSPHIADAAYVNINNSITNVPPP